MQKAAIKQRLMEPQQQIRRRLVMVVCPFQGHINPILQLATILHCKGGFSITIAHPNFNSPNPNNHPQFTFIPIHVDTLQRQTDDLVQLLFTFNRNCLLPFKEIMDQMLQDDDDRIAAIIYDGFMYFAQTVADEMGVAAISVRPNAAATLLTYAVFRSDEKGYITFNDFMPEAKMPVVRQLNLKQILSSATEKLGDKIMELRASVTESIKRSSSIIVHTMDILEQEILINIQEHFPPPIFAIGPFHKLAPTVSTSLLQEDTNCISWLDVQARKSVIYVSFGSMASIEHKELIEIAWGLANSEQPFLWVIRPDFVRGTDNSDLLPKGFEEKTRERGCIVKWAPQREVLAHRAVGGFWTHCGWNSILESMGEGVPMLCRPFFGDQFVNVRYVCDVWKVGVELEGELEMGEVENAVKRLMMDEEGNATRQSALEFKEKIDVCLREGGSSHKELNKLADKLLSC